MSAAMVRLLRSILVVCGGCEGLGFRVRFHTRTEKSPSFEVDVWLCVVVGCAATKKQTNLQVKKIVDRMWDPFTNVSNSQKIGFFSPPPHFCFSCFKLLFWWPNACFLLHFLNHFLYPKPTCLMVSQRVLICVKKKKDKRILALERVLFQNTSYGSDRQWLLCGGMSCRYRRHHLSIL